jgi:hypothetical protein
MIRHVFVHVQRVLLSHVLQVTCKLYSQVLSRYSKKINKGIDTGVILSSVLVIGFHAAPKKSFTEPYRTVHFLSSTYLRQIPHSIHFLILENIVIERMDINFIIL